LHEADRDRTVGVVTVDSGIRRRGLGAGRQGVYHGYLHPKDRYHYDLRAGDRVRIGLSSVTGNLDPFLHASHRDFAVEDDDPGAGSDAAVDFVAPQHGTYDIEISPLKDATFGEYALTVFYLFVII
jgi:hypothetical protein